MIVYGIGSSYVYEVDETLRRLGQPVTAYINNLPGSPDPEGLTPIVNPTQIAPAWLQLPLTIPLITPGHRLVVQGETLRLGFKNFPTLIDPTAVVASTSHKELPEDCVWSVGGIGRAQLPANTLALSLGGGVRVGLEDNIWFDDARTDLASNPRMVERITQIGRLLGRSPMSPVEMRKRLNLNIKVGSST